MTSSITAARAGVALGSVHVLMHACMQQQVRVVPSRNRTYVCLNPHQMGCFSLSRYDQFIPHKLNILLPSLKEFNYEIHVNQID